MKWARGWVVALAIDGWILILLSQSCLYAGPVRTSPGEGADDGPSPWRVYPRGQDGRAAIPLGPPGRARSAELIGPGGEPVGGVTLSEGVLEGVPTGGPYTIQVRSGREAEPERIGPVFVGDLWVLAGQSNMEGRNDFSGAAAPDPRVACLGLDGRWSQAVDPLHKIETARDAVHRGPKAPDPPAGTLFPTWLKGSGPGIAFGTRMAEATGVPIGLIACAKGATPIRLWLPDGKKRDGNSLYGAMLAQVARAGGHVRGVLWYQGEAEASGSGMGWDAGRYEERLDALVKALRSDLGDPSLPFYLVQIGRGLSQGDDPSGWNIVREVQRKFPARVPGTGLVASIDLDVVDVIHLEARSASIVGRRLADRVLHDLPGGGGATTPDLDRVDQDGNRLIVRFSGVNRGTDGAGLIGSGPLTGFSVRGPDGVLVRVIRRADVNPDDPTQVILKLARPVPEGAFLWYGWGFDPSCDLVDAKGMAVPAFGPIPLPGTPGVALPTSRSWLLPAVGSIGGVVAISLAFLILRRRRRSRAQPPAPGPGIEPA